MQGKPTNPWFFSDSATFKGTAPFFLDRKSFPWVERVESQTTVLRDELLKVIEEHEREPARHSDGAMVSKLDYETFTFMQWGLLQPQNCEKCPRTWELLKSIPNAVGGRFTLLEPGTTIKPYAETDAIVRCHLGLLIPASPPHCAIRVGKETRGWKIGEFLMFCDAHSRTEWNNTDERRYLFTVDVVRSEYVAHTRSICSRLLADICFEHLYHNIGWVRRLPLRLTKALLGACLRIFFFCALFTRLSISRLPERSVPISTRPRTENSWAKVTDDRSSLYCVIGAGPTGLAMAAALRKAGIPYEQLEADYEIGGNWRHGVYETTHIISSKKTTEYADFPMPADYPDFPSAAQMLAYLNGYTDYAGIRQHIQFKTKVSFCRPLPDHRWEVTLATGETRIYRGVLVCNGHHWDCRWPNYPGQFTGEYIHAKQYKRPEQLRGKRVLVIGGGNSACDIASEAARVGQSAAISLRRGYWFLPKTFVGRPLLEILPGWMPVWMQRLMLRALLRIVVGKYEDYGLPRPEHRIFDAHPTVNSELLHYIRHGCIHPRPDIARFDGNAVEFIDGRREEFDLVVAATGYHLSFPFLPEGLVPMKNGLPLLYSDCVLPTLKNLYVIGTSQPRYGFGPLLTPSAGLIALMIQLQEKMELPIGLVMRESGNRLPTTRLEDPHRALRDMRRAPQGLRGLLGRERELRSKMSVPVPPPYVVPTTHAEIEVH